MSKDKMIFKCKDCGGEQKLYSSDGLSDVLICTDCGNKEETYGAYYPIDPKYYKDNVNVKLPTKQIKNKIIAKKIKDLFPDNFGRMLVSDIIAGVDETDVYGIGTYSNEQADQIIADAEEQGIELIKVKIPGNE